MIGPLDDLNEECWSVLARLSEKLQEVALIVIVNQDLKFLDCVEVFFDADWRVCESFSQVLVVGFRDIKEFTASFLHEGDCFDDVLDSDGNVLNSWSSKVVDKFLNLTFSFSWSWFVNWHFNDFVKICHDNRSQS